MRATFRFALVLIAILCVCSIGAQQPAPHRPPVPPPEARVDINHATAAELMKVPGMTASWAGRIVRFRPYRSKQDLLDHGVVTSEVYDRIKDYIIAHHDKQY
jgi:DNA uptake protein ComE-like DNA-binding protein